LFAVGLLAMLTLAAAVLARWPQVVGWGLMILALEYGFSLVGRSGLDIGAPLYAASLLVVGELTADLAGAQQPRGPGRFWREAGRVLVLAVVAGAVASVILGAAALAGEAGAVVQVIGVAAAGAALVVLVVLANERVPSRD
jgi:hypothetical protein